MKDIEARRASVQARLDELTETERALARDVGTRIAAGKTPPAKLRDQRRDVRDEIEDLTAALPHLDSEAEKARGELRAERAKAAGARLTEAQGACTAWGDKLRALLQPVAEHLDTEASLDALYKDAQRPVSGRADGHAADAAGFGIRRLAALRTAVVEALR